MADERQSQKSDVQKMFEKSFDDPMDNGQINEIVEDNDEEIEDELIDDNEDDTDCTAALESLNTQLDALNSALDALENKNDHIRTQLVDLLQSNRETRLHIQESTTNAHDSSKQGDSAGNSKQ